MPLELTIDECGTIDVEALLRTLKGAGLTEFEFSLGDLRISGSFAAELPAQHQTSSSFQLGPEPDDDEAMWLASGVRPLTDRELEERMG